MSLEYIGPMYSKYKSSLVYFKQTVPYTDMFVLNLSELIQTLLDRLYGA
jgi:hypothetical protein